MTDIAVAVAEFKIYDAPRGTLTFVTTVDDSVTQNVCNVGKSRKPNLDMRGICAAPQANAAIAPDDLTVPLRV